MSPTSVHCWRYCQPANRITATMSSVFMPDMTSVSSLFILVASLLSTKVYFQVTQLTL